jgi:hypothetical protein
MQAAAAEAFMALVQLALADTALEVSEATAAITAL